MTMNMTISEISTNDPVVQAVKADLLTCEPRNALARLDDIEQSIGEIRDLMIAKLPVSVGGMGGRTMEEIEDILEHYDISVYEAEDMPGYFGFTGCDADDYGSLEGAAIAAMQSVAETTGIDFG